MSWRLIASGPSAARDSVTDVLARRPQGRKSTRKARFDGADVDTPVYQRRDSRMDQSIEGPAIIEERETTIIILPGWTRDGATRPAASWPRKRDEL